MKFERSSESSNEGVDENLERLHNLVSLLLTNKTIRSKTQKPKLKLMVSVADQIFNN